ncbi:hypothetical protein Scep_003647 [Stephania cephalantha]|uniref:G-patch domain-containing protein n=1 Tax=Stephania cephalantha TaxID=152367 RepID=A0AAP0PUN3_9MAGN
MEAATPNNNNNNNNEDNDDDYMGDLSLFLPPSKPSSSTKTLAHHQPSNKKLKKTLTWQEQRKLDRERKQREEDEKTLENINSPIPQSNIGFKMLKMMGYSPGSALGKGGAGAAEPVALEIRRSRRGIGKEDPLKERQRREEARVCEERRRADDLVAEFGTRQKSQWRGRRVAVNFGKAKAALDQLEDREAVEGEKSGEDGDGDGEDGDEEEEEVITEEDLQNILMKLRDEHRYCLFCGCQYESTEALLSNCPGIDEDDH